MGEIIDQKAELNIFLKTQSEYLAFFIGKNYREAEIIICIRFPGADVCCISEKAFTNDIFSVNTIKIRYNDSDIVTSCCRG